MNKIIAKRQLAERQDRIDKVLAAAIKLFTNRGYLNTNVRDIALEAQVSTGVIYYYFKGKDDIFSKICEDGFKIIIALFKKAARGHDNHIDRIVAIANAYLEFYQEYPQYFSILIFMDRGFKRIGLPAGNVKKLDELLTQALSIITEEFEQARQQGFIIYEGNNKDLTFLLWSTLYGIVTINERGYLDRYDLDLRKLFNIQVELLIKSVINQNKRYSASKQ